MCGIGGHWPPVVRLPNREKSTIIRSSARRRIGCVVCNKLFTPSISSTHGLYETTLRNLWYEAKISPCFSCSILLAGILNLLRSTPRRPRRDSFLCAAEETTAKNEDKPGGSEEPALLDLCVEYQSDPNFECPALMGGWRVYCRCSSKPCAHEMYHLTFDVFTLINCGALLMPKINIPLKTCRIIESPHTGSSDTISFLKDCLSICQASHDCIASKTLEISTSMRLLRLYDDHVRLVEVTDAKEVRYACLAHRWATKNPWDDSKDMSTPYAISRQCRTLQANFEQHKQGLAISALLPTYQDAIFVAKSLGIEYLWIDSLCIIQNNTTDKLIQIANMGAIYANSLLTIAADAATDHTHSFLKTRTWNWHAQKEVFHHNQQPNSRSSSSGSSSESAIYFRERPTHTNLSWTGLFNRGWCFQERLLSPRVVRFTSQEAIFECNDGLKCECGSSPAGHQGPWESLSHSIHEHDKAAFAHNVLNKKAANGAEAWHHIVHAYSRTEFTDETDRVNALAGIAARVQGLKGGEVECGYFAGLWRSTLVEDLLWFIDSEAANDGVQQQQQDVSGFESAIPSWSWMSVPLGRNRVLYAVKRDFEMLVRVGEVQYRPSAECLRFGNVLPGAWIELDGEIISARLDGVGGIVQPVLPASVSGGVIASSRVSWDPGRGPTVGLKEEVCLLRMACWYTETIRKEAFLILWPFKMGMSDCEVEVESFVRAGYLEIHWDKSLGHSVIEGLHDRTESRRIRLY